MIGSIRSVRSAGTTLAMNAVAIITPAVDRERHDVERLHRIELRLDESSERRRGNAAGDDADHREHQALADDQPHQLAAIGAKRGADADLARALADPIRQQPVDADDRQRQRRRGEHAVSQVRNRLAASC